MINSLELRPVQARTIGRLKWRLWRNGFRRGPGQILAMVLGIIVSLSIGLGSAVAGVAARGVSIADHRVALAVLGLMAWMLALVGPLVAGGIDETLPLSLLRPYPISRSALARGLLFVGILGPVPVAVGIAILGSIIGVTHSVTGAIVASFAGAILFLLLIVTARVLPTMFARVLNSRKGRDAAVAMASLAGLSGFLFQFIARYFSQPSGARFRSFGRAARWTPPGALGRAMVDGGHGHLAAALPGLAVGLGGLVAVVAVWMWALGRLEEQSPANDQPRAIRATNAPLFSPGLSWLPRSAIGAIAARQVRYTLREPRRRVSMIMSLAIGVVFPLLNNATRGQSSAVLFGAGASWLLVLSGMNQFGIDGRSLWFDLMSGASPASLLKGRCLGLLVFAVPIVTVSAVTLAALTNGWAYLPAALLVGAATSAAGLGAACVTSVIAPMRVPEGTNPFAMNNSGQGCVAPLLGMIGLGAMALLLSPLVIALALLRNNAGLCAVIGLVAVPYGYLLWWLAIKMAAKRLVQREAELIELVDPRK